MNKYDLSRHLDMLLAQLKADKYKRGNIEKLYNDKNSSSANFSKLSKIWKHQEKYTYEKKILIKDIIEYIKTEYNLIAYHYETVKKSEELKNELSFDEEKQEEFYFKKLPKYKKNNEKEGADNSKIPHYFIYHYLDEDYNLDKALLKIFPYKKDKKAELVIYRFGDASKESVQITITYKGKVEEFGNGNARFAISFTSRIREKKKNGKKVGEPQTSAYPSLAVFKGDYHTDDNIVGGYMSSEHIAGGKILLERAENETVAKSMREVKESSREVYLTVTNTRFDINKESKEIKSNLNALLNKGEIVSTYEAYVFEVGQNQRYKFAKTRFEILEDSRIRYESTSNPGDEEGHQYGYVVEYEPKPTKTLIIKVSPDRDKGHNHYSLEIGIDLNKEHDYYLGIYGGTEHNNSLIGGRVIFFPIKKPYEELAQEDYYIDNPEQLKQLFETDIERGKILRQFFRGEIGKYNDPPDVLDKCKYLAEDYTFATPESKEEKYIGYYYSLHKQYVRQFEMFIDFQNYTARECGLYSSTYRRTFYKGKVENRYESLDISFVTGDQENDTTEVKLYTGGENEVRDFISGAYLSVTANGNHKIGGEILLISEEIHKKDSKGIKTIAERYILTQQQSFRVKGENFTTLKELKQVNNLHNLEELRGVYKTWHYNANGDIIQSKLSINDNYSIKFVLGKDRKSGEEFYCKLLLSPIPNSTSQVAILFYKNDYNFESIAILDWRRVKSDQIEHIEGIFATLGKEFMPSYSSPLILERVHEEDVKNLKPTVFAKSVIKNKLQGFENKQLLEKLKHITIKSIENIVPEEYKNIIREK